MIVLNDMLEMIDSYHMLPNTYKYDEIDHRFYNERDDLEYIIIVTQDQVNSVLVRMISQPSVGLSIPADHLTLKEYCELVCSDDVVHELEARYFGKWHHQKISTL